MYRLLPGKPLVLLMSLGEPTTTLTDYGLAIIAASFSMRLFLRVRESGQTCHWLWALGFLATAAAAGGTFHGFRPVLEATVTVALWNVTIFSLVSALHAWFQEPGLRLWAWKGGAC